MYKRQKQNNLRYFLQMVNQYNFFTESYQKIMNMINCGKDGSNQQIRTITILKRFKILIFIQFNIINGFFVLGNS